MVGLNKHAQSEAAFGQFYHPGGGADAAFYRPWQTIPVPPPTAPSSKSSPAEAMAEKDMLLLHGALTDIVEGAIVTLADNGIHRSERDIFGLAALHHIFHQGIVHQADI